MIKGAEPISSKDFNKGLVTRSDFLKGDIDSSPNTMDVQWNFDASLHKRLGCSSVNSVSIGSTALAGWSVDSGGTLTTGLQSYWKLDEFLGKRSNQVSQLSLNDLNNNIFSVAGIRGQAANFISINQGVLYIGNNSSLNIGTGNFSISSWFYTNTLGITQEIVTKRNGLDLIDYQLLVSQSGGVDKFLFQIGSGPFAIAESVFANSLGAINTSTWYNVIAWHSNNSHIGISVNLSSTTAPYTLGGTNSTANFHLGAQDTAGNLLNPIGNIDEVGIWNKVLSTQERIDLFGGGSANTYTGQGNSGFAWASFDFGASSIRWLTISAGTGIYASSNLGTTFVTIATSRTQNYQSLTRSKNVLIATSDSYDAPLYWAGSATTFANTLAPNSAPMPKFAINYQGFLILLNFMNSNSVVRNRGFAYADENLQLTDSWQNSFDIPSSADDEITAAFILYKFLYISTRFTIYRVAFVGGNPDWSYLKVKDWGYVPRTVQIVSLKGGGQVALGMDWQRRIRAFDGFDDMFVSDNIENDNDQCNFAMEKISYAGSGLIVSHAVLNTVTQEYRMNVAIGADSTQTTHGIVLNARNLAFYPYSNQMFQTMCMAQSNNQSHLMAADRSGFVYILDSGNLDVATPVNEVYDSPPLFSKMPEMVSKGKQLNLFFAKDSCGTVFYQERYNLSATYPPMKRLTDREGASEMTGTENMIKLVRTIDVKATYNTIQFRFTSSAGTANPWQLDRLDYLQQGFGIGQG